MEAIHLTKALAMLNRGERVSLDVVKKDGSIMHCDDAVSLRYDHYTGLRTIKLLRSNQPRTIRDVCIIAINDFSVYL